MITSIADTSTPRKHCNINLNSGAQSLQPSPVIPNTKSSRTKTQISNTRPNRIPQRTTLDDNPGASYGSSIQRTKQEHCLRIFFQNIKGLSHTHSREDYIYYLDQFRDLQVDIAGLAETNTAWQHQFLRQEFTSQASTTSTGLSKTSFGSPSPSVDFIPSNGNISSWRFINPVSGLLDYQQFLAPTLKTPQASVGGLVLP
jgi:hypothetical protein